MEKLQENAGVVSALALGATAAASMYFKNQIAEMNKRLDEYNRQTEERLARIEKLVADKISNSEDTQVFSEAIRDMRKRLMNLELSPPEYAMPPPRINHSEKREIVSRSRPEDMLSALDD